MSQPFSRLSENILALYWRLILASSGDGTQFGQAASNAQRIRSSWLLLASATTSHLLPTRAEAVERED